MKEIDGVRQIGGLRKEISDAMGKVEDWEGRGLGKPEHREREWERTLQCRRRCSEEGR